MDRYAVMGNPIGHSLSPRIHAAFAAQTGEKLQYTAIQVDPGRFEQAVASFHAEHGCGLNITVPFKQEAWSLASRRTGRAERAGAVNTLWWDAEDRMHGDTTDGVGLIRDLRENLGVAIVDARVLLVGAGGAARGVVEPLLAERPAELFIVNRTASKAHELAALFQTHGKVQAGGFADLDRRRFDLVINATAAGLSAEVPPLPSDLFAPLACAYDMMYGREPTAFVTWAQEQGVERAWDGLGMLVEQAAESFLRWRGVRPETAAVIAGLRAD